MPIIHMHMVEGRTSEQKAAVAKAVTDAVVQTLEVPEQSVRILFVDLKNDGFYVGGKRSAGAAEHLRAQSDMDVPAK
jgi:4-oxalocrotonate tautomerase